MPAANAMVASRSKPADAHREALRASLCVRREQLVGPVDGGRAASGGVRARRAARRSAVRNWRSRRRSISPGVMSAVCAARELDRERIPSRRRAQRLDRRRVPLVKGGARRVPSRAWETNSAAGLRSEDRCRGRSRSGRVERRQREDVLAPHAESLAAGHQDRHARRARSSCRATNTATAHRRGARSCRGRARSRWCSRCCCKPVSDRNVPATACSGARPQRHRADRLDHHSGELAQPDAVFDAREAAPRRPGARAASCRRRRRRRSRRAATRRAGAWRSSLLLFPTDEAAQLVREVGEVRVDRSQRWMHGGRARNLDLEEVDGALQIAQAVLAEIDEVEVVAHELLDDAGAHAPGRRARPT